MHQSFGESKLKCASYKGESQMVCTVQSSIEGRGVWYASVQCPNNNNHIFFDLLQYKVGGMVGDASVINFHKWELSRNNYPVALFAGRFISRCAQYSMFLLSSPTHMPLPRACLSIRFNLEG